MEILSQDLIDRPVVVRTTFRSDRIEGAILHSMDGQSILLETAPGDLTLIPWTAVLVLEVDFPTARREHWFAAPDSDVYRGGRRRLFEAERAQAVGLSEEKVDDLAMRAELAFRRVAVTTPDAHKHLAYLRKRAVEITTTPADKDPDPSVTTGAVDIASYRRGADRAAKLKAALAARKPEDEIAPMLIALAAHAASGLALYPKHAEFQEWFDKAESLRKELSDKMRREYELESAFVAPNVPPKTGLYAEELPPA